MRSMSKRLRLGFAAAMLMAITVFGPAVATDGAYDGTEIGSGKLAFGNGRLAFGNGEPVPTDLVAETFEKWEQGRQWEESTEIVSPKVPGTKQTQLRITKKDDPADEELLEFLEEIGWTRFIFKKKPAVYLERKVSKALRALEVKIFKTEAKVTSGQSKQQPPTQQIYELVLLGEPNSSDYRSVHEWLTPKKQSAEKEHGD